MKTGVVTLLTSVILSSTSVLAADVSELVSGMSAADKRFNYEGVFILRKSDDIVAMRVVHGVDDRGVWESMESLNGEARKIVRHNDKVISIYPNKKLVTVSRAGAKTSLHPTLPENLEKLSKYYSIRNLGDDRIAGRDTEVLDVQPKDDYRYGYKYWLDRDTDVLLKCDLLNEKGEIVEQMMYTSFTNKDSVPASAFSEPSIEGYDKRTLNKDEDMTTDTQWQVTDLPEGFMLTHSSVRSTESGDSLHLMYSDGLASVSVFIEPHADAPHKLDGESSMGALNAYGKRVEGSHVTVMGEVPKATVSQIAQSMEYKR